VQFRIDHGIGVNQREAKGMTSARRFLRCRFGAMSVAALAFGVVHGAQVLAEGTMEISSSRVNISSIFTLIVYEAIQVFVFLCVSFMFAYIPSRSLEIVAQRTPSSMRYALSALTGVLIAVLFLPLCASVAFLSFYAPDLPSYLDRCSEFALPMIIAGAVGGISFVRCSVQYRDYEASSRL
jgi:hypothetical protein